MKFLLKMCIVFILFFLHNSSPSSSTKSTSLKSNFKIYFYKDLTFYKNVKLDFGEIVPLLLIKSNYVVAWSQKYLDNVFVYYVALCCFVCCIFRCVHYCYSKRILGLSKTLPKNHNIPNNSYGVSNISKIQRPRVYRICTQAKLCNARVGQPMRTRSSS